MVLRFFNTPSRRVEDFVPLDPTGERVTFYTCGPTVYDDAHIGNFRSFLAADVLRRWLESPLCRVRLADGSEADGPRRVEHVMNITDVGHMTDDAVADGAGQDKMEAAARRLREDKKAGRLPDGAGVDPDDPAAIAKFYAGRFLEDARRLGLKVAIEEQSDPTLMPRPTRKIPEMISLIQRLIASGHAYAVGEPGGQTVYFHVPSFPSYGVLSGNTPDRLRVGAGGRVSDEHVAQKRHPADFLLWKTDPRHIMKWDSPWGQGYPGWHLECSVMALECLAGGLEGSGRIDIHSGGEDNIFPHHECENAQSCAATGADCFARYWFHPRHLMVEGAKMSKSGGTFYTARDLFARGIEPAALRLELIKTHYRSNANFTMQGLKDSQRMIERWRRFVESAGDAGTQGESQPGDDQRDRAAQAFADAMSDDLSVAGALAALNTWIGSVEQATPSDAELMRTFDGVLGVLDLEQATSASTEIGVFASGVEPRDEVVALLEERLVAREARDFARADAIRDELAQMGYAIKDLSGGRVEVSRAR